MKRNYQKGLLAFIVFFIAVNGSAQNKSMWAKIKKTAVTGIEKVDDNYPDKGEIYQLDMNALRASLLAAPVRGLSNKTSTVIIDFPVLNGETEKFMILEAPVMHPDLAAKYPNMKSYVGKGIDDPSAIIRFSLSNEKGLSSVLFSGTKNTIYIAPYTNDLTSYIVYDRSGPNTGKRSFQCLTDDVPYVFKKPSNTFNNKDADDQILRSYRLAVSVTGEYTAFHGGTIAAAMAAINTTITRVNSIYEKDFAVTLVLIPNNDTLVYTNAATDPYGAFGLNGDLQSTLTSIITESNYDIGHLLHEDFDNGNAGCIGCVCVNGQKGSGFSSHSNPQGDNFDIDYVAHEIGHQFGGNHSWTHGGNESTGVQMEPGSGSSIMGYAGITGASNVQLNSDDYFHHANIEQITNYISGTSCQTDIVLTNSVPTADAGNDYTIPRGTAFILEGTGVDADGDVLTYNWEQADVGFSATTSVSASNVSGPNFRSFPSTISPDRYMPQLSDVIAGNLTTQWETVSDVARTMNFALTVRDNAIGGGQNKIDKMIVTVDGASGPFQVTSQSGSTTWDEGTTVQVTWNVANTTSAPVSTANVDVFLSLDGGNTFPMTLATNVPNNGVANVLVPSGATTSTARVMVRGAGNIFYAVNGSDFSIQTSEFVMNFDPTFINQSICAPGTITYNFTHNTFLGFNGVTTFSASGNPTGSTVSFNPTTAQIDGTPVVMTITGLTPLMIGNYQIAVTGSASTISKSTTVDLNVLSSSFNTLTLSSPIDGSTGVAGPYTLTWVDDPNAETYDVEVATDAAFNTIVDSVIGVTNNSYVGALALISNTDYFWRVRPSNQCAVGTFSNTFSFTSSNCISRASNNVPISISSSLPATVTSTLNIGFGGTINDLNVINLNGVHSQVGDLIVTLTSPQNTTITLWDRVCSTENNFDINFDDSSPVGSLPCPPIGGGTYQSEDALSAFNGENPQGDWVLSILDVATQGGGGLISWGLEVCVNSGFVSISELDKLDGVNIYPNPTNDVISIDISGVNDVKQIILMDLRGSIVYQSNHVNDNLVKIDLSDFSSGLYSLRVETIESSKVYKVVKN